MSLTATNIFSKINKATGANDTSYPLADKAVDCNLAIDEAFAIIFNQSGTARFDDANHTDDPILFLDLASGTRKYRYTNDDNSNLVLDIQRVQVADADGFYRDLERVDLYNSPATFDDGDNTTGTPTKYRLAGNAVLLDLIPSYSYTDGLKLFINRQGNYLTSADDTMVIGIDGLCHDFVYLKPAYEYARDKDLKNREALFRDLERAKQKIIDRYRTKENNVISRFIPFSQNNK